MKHFFSSLILLVAITSAMLSTLSCTNDEGDITAKTIIGTWKLEKIGSSPWTGKEKTLLFQQDGRVICHSEYMNYQGKYVLNNVSVKEGTMICDLIIFNDDGTQTNYWCTLSRNILSLNNSDLTDIVDGTEYYKRIY
jgi:hypothetical protein